MNRLAPFALLCFSLLALPVAGADEEPAGPELRRAADHADREIHEGKQIPSLLPFPVGNPTLGAGLGLAATRAYRLGKSVPSTTTLAGFVTEEGSWALGLEQRTRLVGDAFRIDAGLRVSGLDLDYYGVGAEAGRAGVSVGHEQNGHAFELAALGRIARNLYAGPLVSWSHTDVKPAEAIASVPLPTEPVPVVLASGTAGALGFRIHYDDRDPELDPNWGATAGFEAAFADPAIGGDFEFQRYEGNLNLYGEVQPDFVVAFQAVGCGTGGDVPFYRMCRLGTGLGLRGYPADRHRDKVAFTSQIELRRRLPARFTLVAFGGVGEVAPTIGELGSVDLLGSYGAGARYMVWKERHLNLSLDYGRGAEGGAWYFYVGQSF